MSSFLVLLALAMPSHGATVTELDAELYWAGGTRERLRQSISGVPVERGRLVVARDPWGQRVATYGRELPPELELDTTPTVSPEQAREQGQAVAHHFGRGTLWPARSEQVAWVDEVGQPHLAWAVDASTSRPIGTWRVLVDAHSGQVLHTRPTTFSADASLYPVNPWHSDLQTVELRGLDASGTLAGEYAAAWTCTDAEIDDSIFGTTACHAIGRQAQPDSNGDYFFAPDPAGDPDPLAEVQVYHHTDRVHRWMDERFGLRMELPMRAIVNFEMRNAFYSDFDGDGEGDISFGHDPESGVDFAYDGDVVYHEFGHAVVDEISLLGTLSADEYGMDWAGGSLNEGSADVFAMLLTGDPLMGEYAGRSGGGTDPIRDLDADRRCPDDLYGEVHADGEIWGALFWNLIEHPDVGSEVAGDLLFGAVSTWVPDTDWPAAGVSLLDTAAELLATGAIDTTTHDAIVAEVDAFNLVDCGRVIELDNGDVIERFMTNGGLSADFERIPLGVQFVTHVPVGVDVLEITVSVPEGTPMGWSAFARRGEPVGHEIASLPSLGLAGSFPSVYDAAIDGQETGKLVLSVGPEGDVRNGEHVYFSIASRTTELVPFDFRFSRVSIGVQSMELPRERGGACGCSGTPVAGWWLWMPLLLLVRRSPVEVQPG